MSPTRPPTPYPIFRKTKTPPKEDKNEVVEYCKEMLQKSMLTGVPQIVTAPTTRSKVFKTFVVLGSFSGFLYQTSAFLVMYFSYPTLVDVQVTTPPFVDVPSITICNRNGLRRKAYCGMKPENCFPLDVPQKFCEDYPESCEDGQLKGGNMFPKLEAQSEEMTVTQEVIEEAGHNAYPLVSSCGFTGVNVTFDYCTNTSYKSFIFQDLYGRMNKCYIFNALWSKAVLNLPQVPTRAILKLIVDLEPEEYFRIDQIVTGQLAIHSPWNILNPFSEGFTIKPKKTYIIQLRELYELCSLGYSVAKNHIPQVIGFFNLHDAHQMTPREEMKLYPYLRAKDIKNLLPYPYQTNCTDYIQTWKIRGRNGPLSKEMCIEECILNQTMQNCKCVLTNNLYPHNFKFCGRVTDYCTNSVNFTHCFVKCSPACHDRTFGYTVKEEDIMAGSMETYSAERNWNRTVMLLILFKRTQVNIYRYRAKYESIELFSFLGGFVGIWLGVSLIALLDFLESLATFTVFLVDRVKSNPRIAALGTRIRSRSNSACSNDSIPWAKNPSSHHLTVEDARRDNGHF